DPVEGEIAEAPHAHDALDADSRIEKPFPGGPGDDEGDRHGIEIDGPEDALAPDLLVEQDRKPKSDRGADDDIEPTQDPEILDGEPPIRQGPEEDIVLQADEVEARQDVRVREGEVAREQDEAIDEQKDSGEARRQHETRQEFGQPCPGALGAEAVSARTLN